MPEGKKSESVKGTKQIREKLLAIQQELKAPKNQYNSFGKYNYRNQEDILEAAKPLLNTYECVLVLGDEVRQIGERYYICAKASLIDIKTGDDVQTTAYAREPQIRKGMDESQITGATSSYARKYALNGLFAIDDAKDPDSTNIDGGGDVNLCEKAPYDPATQSGEEDRGLTPRKSVQGDIGENANELSPAEQLDKAQDSPIINAKQVSRLKAIAISKGWDDWGNGVCAEFGFERSDKVTKNLYDAIIERLEIGAKEEK